MIFLSKNKRRGYYGLSNLYEEHHTNKINKINIVSFMLLKSKYVTIN